MGKEEMEEVIGKRIKKVEELKYLAEIQTWSLLTSSEEISTEGPHTSFLCDASALVFLPNVF